jgi:hypothetical protein
MCVPPSFLLLLSRLQGPSSPADPSEDTAWSTFFEVVLIANPRLSPAQQATVQRDYGMQNGRSVLRVRHALLYYLNKRLRLDVAEKQDRPKETPVVGSKPS